MAAAATSGSVAITATGSNCPWTAVSNNLWLKVTGGATGTGSGTVTYAIEANPNTTSRTGSLSIGGKTFTVTQAGAPCSYTVSTFNPNFTANGGSVTIPVTTSSGCSWRAVENVSWLSFTPSTTVTGSQNVVLAVSPKNNALPVRRL
ncbi:MAG: BACON domain-containing carbohydrate-binding protein [Blastocatellia bacterium]